MFSLGCILLFDVWSWVIWDCYIPDWLFWWILHFDLHLCGIFCTPRFVLGSCVKLFSAWFLCIVKADCLIWSVNRSSALVSWSGQVLAVVGCGSVQSRWCGHWWFQSNRNGTVWFGPWTFCSACSKWHWQYFLDTSWTSKEVQVCRLVLHIEIVFVSFVEWVFYLLFCVDCLKILHAACCSLEIN